MGQLGDDRHDQRESKERDNTRDQRDAFLSIAQTLIGWPNPSPGDLCSSMALPHQIGFRHESIKLYARPHPGPLPEREKHLAILPQNRRQFEIAAGRTAILHGPTLFTPHVRIQFLLLGEKARMRAGQNTRVKISREWCRFVSRNPRLQNVETLALTRPSATLSPWRGKHLAILPQNRRQFEIAAGRAGPFQYPFSIRLRFLAKQRKPSIVSFLQRAK